MFENILASIGINSVKVETLVKNKVFIVMILWKECKNRGGSSAQTINKISLTLVERYENPDKIVNFLF